MPGPLIAYWPRGIVEPGRISHEIGHVIDVMATAIDVADARYPTSYRGEAIHSLEGKTLLPILKNRDRAGHDAIFFEWGGGKAIRSGRWKLVDGRGADTVWELYDMEKDRTETNDLAARFPDRVDTLAARWDAWARRVDAVDEPAGSER